MRAIQLTSAGVQFRDDLPVPIPHPDEVLVRVVCAGICETDFQLVQGYMGFQGVLGHEFVGVAETGTLAGQRVVGEINCACRRCPTCRQGLPNHCPKRSVLGILKHDGAFADYVAVPAVNLHRVPDKVSTRAAVFAEPLAAAYQIPAQVPFSGGERVVVLGDGRLGNLSAQVLSGCGCRVTVIGKHERKLARVRKTGIETRLLSDLPEAKSADTVVDCTGSPSGLETALRLVRPRGTVVLKTTVAPPHQLSLAPIVIDELTLVGSRCGPFATALEALAARRVDVESLIDAEFPLDRGAVALERARREPWLKTLLWASPE